MSNLRKNGRGIMGNQASFLKNAKNQRDLLANSVDSARFDGDEAVATEWADIGLPALSVSAELRSISIPIPSFQPLPLAVDTSWITEEQTWMLPAVSKSATVDTQRS